MTAVATDVGQEIEEDDRCSVCRLNPVYIGTMCVDCWQAAQKPPAKSCQAESPVRTWAGQRLSEYCKCCGCIKRYCICSTCSCHCGG